MRRQLGSIVPAVAVAALCLSSCGSKALEAVQSNAGSTTASTSGNGAGPITATVPGTTVSNGGTIPVTRTSRPAGPPLTHAQLVEQLTASCHAADAQEPEPPRNLVDTTPEQARIGLQAQADELDTVRAMTPPPEDADALKLYAAVLQDRFDLVQALLGDVLAGKPITDAEGRKIGDSNRRLVTVWAALGIFDCGGQAPPSSFAPR